MSVAHEVVLNAEDEKVDDDASKLIVSVQKSHGSTSTQTQSGDKQQQEKAHKPPMKMTSDLVVPFTADTDEPESLLRQQSQETE